MGILISWEERREGRAKGENEGNGKEEKGGKGRSGEGKEREGPNISAKFMLMTRVSYVST